MAEKTPADHDKKSANAKGGGHAYEAVHGFTTIASGKAEQDAGVNSRGRLWHHPTPATSPEDVDFMTELTSGSLYRAPRTGRFIIWSTALLLVVSLAWAAFAEVEEAVKGEGRVIPSQQIQVVQNLEGGIVEEILVHEGAVVQKDQILLRINDTRFSSSYRENRIRLLALQVKAARLKAELEKIPFVITAAIEAEQPELVLREKELFDSRERQFEAKRSILDQQMQQRRQELAELKSRHEHLANSYRLMARELELTRPLVKEGAVSEVELLRLERKATEMRGELAATELAIPRVESMYREAQNKIEEQELSKQKEINAELNETLAELARVSESSIALEDRVNRTLVRSPVRGTVKQVLVSTVGGVVQPGMKLVEIVPLEDTLLVETRIKPSDIAFLRPGQPAKVIFSAYDFAIYGGLDAKLEHISADSITDERGGSYYLVRVRTTRSHLGSDLQPLPIIPGMVATVDIMTGKKTVLSYLLKPILRAKERALRER